MTSGGDVPPRPYVYWSVGRERATCYAVRCAGADRLGEAVNAAKQFLGGLGGGSFLINERGQVLVPAPYGSGDVALAGTITGRLVFENPFRPDRPLDLADTRGLETGAAWERPYVGMWYNLSTSDRLYYVRLSHGSETPVTLKDPGGLVSSLRRIRPRGPVRFIVNPHGLVLTKKPPDQRGRYSEEYWTPVYVGRLNPQRWPDEEV